MANEILMTLTSGFVAVMILMTIGIMVYLIIKASKSGGGRSGSRSDEEETRMIQEIYHGLTKMQQRIETLETLVLDDDRSKRDEFERKLNDG